MKFQVVNVIKRMRVIINTMILSLGVAFVFIIIMININHIVSCRIQKESASITMKYPNLLDINLGALKLINKVISARAAFFVRVLACLITIIITIIVKIIII